MTALKNVKIRDKQLRQERAQAIIAVEAEGFSLDDLAGFLGGSKRNAKIKLQRYKEGTNAAPLHACLTLESKLGKPEGTLYRRVDPAEMKLYNQLKTELGLNGPVTMPVLNAGTTKGDGMTKKPRRTKKPAAGTKQEKFDSRPLAKRRGAKLLEKMTAKGLKFPVLAAMLRSDDAGRKLLVRQFHNRMIQLLPYSLMVEIAPLLDVQPSELYLELTPKEAEALGGTPPTDNEKSRQSTRAEYKALQKERSKALKALMRKKKVKTSMKLTVLVNAKCGKEYKPNTVQMYVSGRSMPPQHFLADVCETFDCMDALSTLVVRESPSDARQPRKAPAKAAPPKSAHGTGTGSVGAKKKGDGTTAAPQAPTTAAKISEPQGLSLSIRSDMLGISIEDPIRYDHDQGKFSGARCELNRNGVGYVISIPAQQIQVPPEFSPILSVLFSVGMVK